MITIVIVADENDGDYITSNHQISEEQLAKITPVIEAIKEYTKDKSNHNFPYFDGDLSAEQLYGHIEGFKEFLKFVPRNEYGFHSIESIKLLIGEEKILL